jgi:hypothetical protein
MSVMGNISPPILSDTANSLAFIDLPVSPT